MIIKLKVIEQQLLICETDNNLPHSKSQVIFKGGDRDRDLLKLIEEERGLHGHDGHNVTFSYITNVDLIAAVHVIPEIKVLSISPEIEPDPLPDGAIP